MNDDDIGKTARDAFNLGAAGLLGLQLIGFVIACSLFLVAAPVSWIAGLFLPRSGTLAVFWSAWIISTLAGLAWFASRKR